MSEELDELRQIAATARWMARFQADAIERYQIPGLKIGFNNVFGYYLEVPRGQVGQVPDEFVRKQTLKNAERYITPELKEFEDKVLRAEERAKDMEYEIFTALKDEVAAEVPRILATARALAEIDVLAGLAQTAATRRYCAPTVDGGDRIEIQAGRHPVIEATQTDVTFVPNDTVLDRKDQSVGIITGPNMAGKSTYIRQTALIVLLAQIGSFVPAAEAKIGVVDRIFTRIGRTTSRAAPRPSWSRWSRSRTSSTTRARSQILDEVGRGTSTFDGLRSRGHRRAHARRGPCLHAFATHYHQLTELADLIAACQPVGGRARVGGRDRLPPPDRPGRHRPLRHPGGAAGGRPPS